MKFLIVVLTTVFLSLNVHANSSITISPSSAPTEAEQAEENWVALSDAFANYSIVNLEPGTFYLAQSVVTWDPDVRISGSESGLTILRTAPHFQVVEVGIGDFPTDGMLSFPYHDGYDGNLELRNITIIVDQPANQYERYQWWLGEYIIVNEMSGISVINGELDYGGPYWEHTPVSFDMTFENLRFFGERDGELYKTYWQGFPFAEPNSISHSIVVWGPANATVIARNIVTSNASGSVMLDLGGDSSAIVDGGEFTGSADYYGALALQDIADVSVTSNEMDGYLFTARVSGLIQDNTFLGGSGRYGIIFLNTVNNSLISGNHVEEFTLEQGIGAGIFLWNSDFNDVINNTFVDVLGDGVGAAVIRARGGSRGNDFSFNDLTAAGIPGFSGGVGGILLDQKTTSNYVDLLPPRAMLPGGDPCDMVRSVTSSNFIPGYAICRSGGASSVPGDTVETVTDNLLRMFGHRRR